MRFLSFKNLKKGAFIADSNSSNFILIASGNSCLTSSIYSVLNYIYLYIY